MKKFHLQTLPFERGIGVKHEAVTRLYIYICIYAYKLDGRGQIGPNKFLFINIECFDIDYLIEIIFLALWNE